MKKLFYSYVFIQLSVGLVYSQWYVQAVVTQNDLFAVYFIDSVKAYAVGDSETVIKTADGGANWIIQHTGGPNALFAVDFIDENTGFAVGGDLQPKEGVLFKTTNGGVNWFSSFIDSALFMSVHFVNSNTGVVGAWEAPGSLIYLTTNGGSNWNKLNISNVNEIADISFINGSTGWGTGVSSSGVRVIITTNSGINWTLIWMGDLVEVYSIFFNNANTGWITGERMILKTSNGGVNWFNTYPQAIFSYFGLYFISANTGWVVGDVGNILKTTNGGVNWGRQSTGFQQWLWDVYFTNANTGWAVGGSGTILKTTNSGGPIAISVISSTVPKSFELYQNYPNPFNPVTKIKFDTPPQPSPKDRGTIVKLIVYDVTGREIAILVNEKLSPGTYDVEWDGSNYPSGVYFYKLVVSDVSAPLSITKKMVLIK